MITKDFYLGVFLVLLSLLAYIETRSYPVNSAYFPRFILLIIALLGAATILKELKPLLKNGKVERGADLPEGGRVAFWRLPTVRKVSMMIFSSLAYMVIMGYVGFFVTTSIYLPVMMRLLGIRKPRTIWLSTGIVVISIYLIFGKFLSVPFPDGIAI